jgi:hypothetical protein
VSADAYQVLFSIPQIDSAFMRNPAGGGRLKIDIDQATVAAVNAMLDEAVRRSGVTFAAAIVIVEQEVSFNKETNGRTKRQSKQSQWQTSEESGADNSA